MEYLRTGKWLTIERFRLYSLILAGLSVFVLLAWLIFSTNGVDPYGRPIGTDFSNVYAAGRMVLNGEAAAAYDPASHFAVQQEVFARNDIPFYGWHYPPPFLGVAAILASLPYGWALLAWMGLTFPLYLLAIRPIIPAGGAILAAIAFPAVFINLGHGQNGFLTAALLGGGLAFLNPRPVLAGILFGLLAYKPQFGIYIPLVLLVTGRWQTIASATATVMAMFGGAWLIWGNAVYFAFLESTKFTREVVLETGNTGWEKIQSLFSALRHWGVNLEFAYAAQFVVAAGLAVLLVRLWRSDADYPLKAAALATASLLATPYAMDYDLMALAPAIAFMAAYGFKNGFDDWEISGLAFIAISPMITRSAALYTTIPLGLLALILMMAMILRRAKKDAPGAPAASQNAIVPAE